MQILNDAVWYDTKYQKPMLLFAYTLLESLDELSYDSYQIPTLNIHTFCFDFLQTLDDVEAGILQQGNLIPLIEEFEFYCKNDYITKKIIGDDLCFSLRKTSSGCFCSNSELVDIEAKIKIYRQQMHLILNKILISDDWFIDFLFSELEHNIFIDNYNTQIRDLIYGLTRTLGIELLLRYHRNHIRNKIEKFFFNEKKIRSSLKNWKDFKEKLLAKEQDYSVKIGTNKDLYDILSKTLNGDNRKATTREKRELNSPYVHIYEVKARDPYKACEDMREFCASIANVVKCEQHDVSFELSKRVKCKTAEQKHDQWTFEIKDFIKKRRNKPKDIANKTYNFFFKNYKDFAGPLLKILELHATAIRGSDITNQLLNLWTILETVVATDRTAGYDKCSQICNSITAILNDNYLYSSLIHFYHDICECQINIDSYLERVSVGNSKVEKLLRLLSDKQGINELRTLLGKQELLLMRFDRFSALFTADTAEDIYNFLSAHSNRLRWHLMRIYRNRNLIIHEGDNTPYLPALVDNLHFYVDMTLDFIWQKLFDGFQSIRSILDYAMSLEARRLQDIGYELGKNKIPDKKKFKNLQRNFGYLLSSSIVLTEKWRLNKCLTSVMLKF